MIKEFVDRFEAHKDQVRAAFVAQHPSDYKDVVAAVVGVLADDSLYESPDPKRIHMIDDGDYQGTLVFVIGSNEYQPSTYWYVKVGYGSCSGCDTLQAIRNYDDGPPSKQQVDDYMVEALHVVQGFKKMGDE